MPTLSAQLTQAEATRADTTNVQIASPHASEEARLRSLRALELLDTAAEERFDRLTELVAIIIDVPIALVSLVDQNRQWFKSNHGLTVRETPRDVAFCAHAIVAEQDSGPFVVADALLDERFSDNPLVTGEPNVRFYAGQVLHSPDGLPVGTLCAIDNKPRTLDSAQSQALSHLAALVEAELQGHKTACRSMAVAASEQTKSLILDAVNAGLVLQSASGALLDWNSAAEQLLGLTQAELGERTAGDPRFVWTREDGEPLRVADRPAAIALRTGQPVDGVICGLERPRSERIWLKISADLITDDHGEVQVVTTFTDVTGEVDERSERVRLERDIHHQAHLAQASLDALDQGVILTDINAHISVVNAAAERILGYTAEEITGLWRRGEWQSYDQDGHPIKLDDLAIVRAMVSSSPVVGELVQWRNKSGDFVLLRLTCVPNVEQDSMVVAFSDVTDEHFSRRLLDVTLEMAPAGLAMLDADGVVTRCNPAFADQVGRPAEAVVGLSAFDLIHPDDRPLAHSNRERLSDGAVTRTSLDHRVLRPDGAQRWVHTQIAVVPMTTGQIAIVSTFDITERLELLRDVSRFSYLFEQSNDMISVIDPDGSVQYSSPATARILGHPDEYLDPRGIYGPIHPDDVAVAASAVAEMMSSDEPVEPFTVRTSTADGSWLYIEYAGVDLLDEPAVAGLLITGRDVTQRVVLTDQLTHQASHDTLTNLANRTVVHDELERFLAEPSDRHVGLCFIDLDGFKSINDEFGHAAGDTVLEFVAECLRVNLRSSDTAARIGGDEFVVVLDPVETQADAVKCGERLLAAVVRLAAGLDGLGGFGASVGVSINRPGDTASSMLSRADAAMYRAKARGGGSVAVSADDAAAEARRQGTQPLRLHSM